MTDRSHRDEQEGRREAPLPRSGPEQKRLRPARLFQAIDRLRRHPGRQTRGNG